MFGNYRNEWKKGRGGGWSSVNASMLQSFLLPLLLLAGCKSAQVTQETNLTATPVAKPTVIVVADFELGAESIKHEDSALSGRVGPVGRVGDILSGASADPAARARKLVDLMSESLVKDLRKESLSAVRLVPGSSLPREGWLVRGVFTEVQEGNRVRRALIGFGQGQTDIQVITRIDNLSEGPPKPLYQLATDASSGQGPGAAPTLVLGPYGAAARFVMSGQDLEKNVKQTASQIATQVAKRVQAAN